MKSLPKTELHLHLEGAAPPRFIQGLAAEKSIDLTGVFDEQGKYRFSNFAEFLKVYEAATSVLQTPQDYARLTQAVLEIQAAHNIVYTETFLSPEFCGGNDLGAWREFLQAIQEAAEQAYRQDGVILRGIVTAIRHLGPDRAKGAALCAAETVGDWLVGFGIAGAETVGEPKDFAYSFDMAREAELGLTAHAGEWRGPTDIKATLQDLRVARLGHGVRAIEDLSLVDHLAEQRILLEICPGSNIALGVYPRWEAHPIERLRERGVRLSISTDDPPFFHTDLSTEYDCLADIFGWTEADFAQINRDAMDAAFCNQATLDEVLKHFPKDS